MIANFNVSAFVIGALLMFSSQSKPVYSDYRFSMGEGYEFVSCNPVETLVCDSGDNVIFTPLDYRGVGPILEYAHSSDFLILKTAGRENRTPDQVNKSDFSKRFFFTISGNKVTGPYSENELAELTGEESFKTIKWRSANFRNLAVLLFSLTALLLGVFFTVFLWRAKGGRLGTATN